MFHLLPLLSLQKIFTSKMIKEKDKYEKKKDKNQGSDNLQKDNQAQALRNCVFIFL